MKFVPSLLSACVAAKTVQALATPHNLQARDTSNTATVTLGSQIGTPSHLASGIIYGIPDGENQIPAEFIKGMGLNYCRAGGAQTPQPGWYAGRAGYDARFQSTLKNYKTCRANGARMQILIPDLWGADTTEPDNAAFPGDNGDWSSYDSFLDTLIADIKSNGMTEGLDLDIWNEPDGYGFWKRDIPQYLQMWGRGYTKLRAAFGNNVLLVGPSLASQPSTSNQWWTQYLSYIAENNVVPDQYTWHIEGDPNNSIDDPQQNGIDLTAMLSNYKLPLKPFNTNEYAIPSEQQPAGAAWFISRLERNNMIGLRGNWASKGELHDYLANLLGKPGAGTSSYSETGSGYWANGEYQVYQYYVGNMTGQRVKTTGAGDNRFDVYATSNGAASGVKVLCGSRLTTGTWYININGLTAVGRPAAGNVEIRTYRFDFTGGTYGKVSAPVDMGVYSHAYSGDSVTFPVTPADQNTAYAFELV